MPSAIPPFLYSLIIINYQLFDCEDFHVLSKQRIIVKLILHQFNRDQMIDQLIRTTLLYQCTAATAGATVCCNIMEIICNSVGRAKTRFNGTSNFTVGPQQSFHLKFIEKRQYDTVFRRLIIQSTSMYEHREEDSLKQLFSIFHVIIVPIRTGVPQRTNPFMH